MSLPKRTADTMSDAIALSSPSGRMSKRARAAAEKRLAVALFGPNGLTREALTGGPVPQPSLAEKLRRDIAMWRDLHARGVALGMKTKKYAKAADAAEIELAKLEGSVDLSANW